jgi:hypothetical protein
MKDLSRVLLACGVLLLPTYSRVQAGSVQLAWDPTQSDASWLVSGYHVYYGPASLTYTNELDAGTNWFLTVDGLDTGATYFFAVTAYDENGLDGPDSNEISLTTPFPPIIISQPSSQIAQAGVTAALFVDVIGTPPVTFQWFNGSTPIVGGTNSILKLPQIADPDSGSYSAVITDSEGSVTTALASVTVIDPLIVTPALSDVATATANVIARTAPSLAGTYNGLFYQTNNDGTPAIDIQSTGLLSDCVVNSKGVFTATIDLDGVTNSVAGAFDDAGNAVLLVNRSDSGLFNLAVSLNLDLLSGTLQMSGTVSNMDRANPWTAILNAELQTNGPAPRLHWLLSIPSPDGSSAGSAAATEHAGNVFISGNLCDGTAISDSVPVSVTGMVPLLIPLGRDSGLLAGWLDLSAKPSTSPITWVCPSFTNIVNVTVFGGE